uniref:phosphoribosylformylglycinamidine synthase n=1 Tax=Lonchura striata TaxID=40157 RepID=UPI000B4C70D2
TLLWVQLNPGRHRLGGSALAQVFAQLGDDVPDLDEPGSLEGAFNVTQELLQERALLAGHDVSDGGLLGCVLEMAFAGNCGVTVGVPAPPPGVTQAPGPRVAVLREEGSNGDREMAAAFAMAGFQVWDVTTQDLCSDGASLDGFRGLVFVGGFSYGDVLGSAK